MKDSRKSLKTIPDRVQEISFLLSQAGMAHHEYEQNVLKGVYDSES